MTIEVKHLDGSAAFMPVSATDGDGGLEERCSLTCEVWNRDHPDDLWILYRDGEPVATDELSEAWIAAQETGR